jgi:DNA-directed RNA polymerase subunit RPC12/RpoP
MGLTISHGCPQCGAPIQLDETDHLISCPYCEVKSLILSADYFHYVLPDKAPPDKELIFVPYLRFKGVVYFCNNATLNYRIVDITHLGLSFKSLPASLGVRPQAMKLKFVKPDTRGAFLKFSLKAADIIAAAARLSSGTSKAAILHRAFIGETMNIIYLPVYPDGNRLFDGVLNRQIAYLPNGIEDLAPEIINHHGWGPKFVAALCPRCGWKLDGERDSVALLCRNCQTGWEIEESCLKEVDISLAQGSDSGSLYMPFWRIIACVNGVDIKTFSDFIRITNQPFIVDEARGCRDMNFFSPAFKLRPNFFLNLARQFTILQMDPSNKESLSEKNMYPVTLPKTEAVQALKVILASTAVNKKNIFPYLPQISFEIKGLTLVYLPFTDVPGDMIHEDTGICINRPSLEFGRKM